MVVCFQKASPLHDVVLTNLPFSAKEGKAAQTKTQNVRAAVGIIQRGRIRDHTRFFGQNGTMRRTPGIQHGFQQCNSRDSRTVMPSH